MSTSFSQRTSLQIPKSLSFEDSDITWSGDCWTCSKQLKHYPAFSRRGTSIRVHSFVWILNKGTQEHIGYVEDMYDDAQGMKMAEVRYFLYAEEVESHVCGLLPRSREVFITPLLHEIRVSSIGDVASVLNSVHFSKCDECLPQALALKTFVSEREFKEGTVHPFDPSNLRGYSNQPILNYLEHYEVSNQARNRDIEPECPLKRARDSKSDAFQIHMFPRIDDNVEVLCQYNGCWYRCKVLHSTGNRVEVLHYDVLDHDGQNKKEWVTIKVAGKDKLGMRHEERLTVRPWPQWDPLQVRFEIGKPVDVWQLNGWFEGVTIGKDLLSTNGILQVQVYFPGKNMFLQVERKDVRLSKEWFKGEWLSLNANPDIHSLLRRLLTETPSNEKPIETPPKKQPPQSVISSASPLGPGGSSVNKRPKRSGLNIEKPGEDRGNNKVVRNGIQPNEL